MLPAVLRLISPSAGRTENENMGTTLRPSGSVTAG